MKRETLHDKAKKKDDLNRDEPLYPEQVLEFTIPIPLSVNHMYQNVGRGARRLSKDAERYIKVAQDIVKKRVKEVKWKRDKEHVWYIMELNFFFPDKKRRDSHNTLKLLTDCLEGLLYYDDYYLLPRVMHVELDKENPRLEVKYYPEDTKKVG